MEQAPQLARGYSSGLWIPFFTHENLSLVGASSLEKIQVAIGKTIFFLNFYPIEAL
jgi:hypothetical protein